jgi:hypothetical protein
LSSRASNDDCTGFEPGASTLPPPTLERFLFRVSAGLCAVDTDADQRRAVFEQLFGKALTYSNKIIFSVSAGSFRALFMAESATAGAGGPRSTGIGVFGSGPSPARFGGRQAPAPGVGSAQGARCLPLTAPAGPTSTLMERPARLPIHINAQLRNHPSCTLLVALAILLVLSGFFSIAVKQR